MGLLLIVKADGSVRDVQITKPAGYGMDERATECIRRWRFKPGAKDGSPVDVAFQFGYDFRLAPEPRLWGAGPIEFDLESGATPPVLKSGGMPTGQHPAGDEIVLLRFMVNPTGEVSDIQPVEGKESAALPVLTKNLHDWKFAPASNTTGPMAVHGKVLFIKGEDYFRYQVSKAFRDTGSPYQPKPTAVDGSAGRFITIKVPVRTDLEPDEAMKHLVNRVSPEYPADAKAARIQGTVSLLVSIGKDGSVRDVKGISGPPELIPSAVAAVKQWRYRPIIVSGQPTEASTVVDIPFKLPGQP